MTAIPNGGIFAITNIFRKSVIPNGRMFGITSKSINPIFNTKGGCSMTDNEKKLLQAKHRLEEAQMRDPAERTQGTDTAADSGGCDFRKGLSGCG